MKNIVEQFLEHHNIDTPESALNLLSTETFYNQLDMTESEQDELWIAIQDYIDN